MDNKQRKVMREAEKKKRDEAIKEVATSSPGKLSRNSPVNDPVMSFDEWWMDFQRLKEIRPSYKNIIRDDFKARGLSLDERKSVFYNALKMFGISLED